MNPDALHRATVDVLSTVARHLAGASFLIGMLSALLSSGSQPQTLGLQLVGAVFGLSLFVTIGTSFQLWAIDRQARRRRDRQVAAQGVR